MCRNERPTLPVCFDYCLVYVFFHIRIFTRAWAYSHVSTIWWRQQLDSHFGLGDTCNKNKSVQHIQLDTLLEARRGCPVMACEFFMYWDKYIKRKTESKHLLSTPQNTTFPNSQHNLPQSGGIVISIPPLCLFTGRYPAPCAAAAPVRPHAWCSSRPWVTVPRSALRPVRRNNAHRRLQLFLYGCCGQKIVMNYQAYSPCNVLVFEV